MNMGKDSVHRDISDQGERTLHGPLGVVVTPALRDGWKRPSLHAVWRCFSSRVAVMKIQQDSHSLEWRIRAGSTVSVRGIWLGITFLIYTEV